MYSYFHWCMYNTTDGEKLIIPDISVVYVKEQFDTNDAYSTVNVHLKKDCSAIPVIKCTLYKSEKKALEHILQRLKQCIIDLTDESGRVAPPINPDQWLCKVKAFLNTCFDKYAPKYPELFV